MHPASFQTEDCLVWEKGLGSFPSYSPSFLDWSGTGAAAAALPSLFPKPGTTSWEAGTAMERPGIRLMVVLPKLDSQPHQFPFDSHTTQVGSRDSDFKAGGIRNQAQVQPLHACFSMPPASCCHSCCPLRQCAWQFKSLRRWEPEPGKPSPQRWGNASYASPDQGFPSLGSRLGALPHCLF